MDGIHGADLSKLKLDRKFEADVIAIARKLAAQWRFHLKDNPLALRQERPKWSLGKAVKQPYSLRLHLVQHWRAPGLQAAVVVGQACGFLAAAYELLQFTTGGFHRDIQKELL